MNLKFIRTIAWVALGFVVAAAAGYVVMRQMFPTAVTQVGRAGLTTPVDGIGGPFALTDSNGKPVTDADFRGKPLAIFFGYTHCPDVCPTTLAEASDWLKTLGPDGDKLRFAFVTVDPERDTPASLKSYLSSFDERIVGLSGDKDAVAKTLKGFRVYARKVGDGADYTMDHTAAVYLMNADLKFVGLINYQEDPEKALAKLKALIGAG